MLRKWPSLRNERVEHMDIDTKERAAEIRRLNHQFRTTFRDGQILLTHGVEKLPDMVKASARHSKRADARPQTDKLSVKTYAVGPASRFVVAVKYSWSRIELIN
jgi:hypothetical protein